MGGAAGLRGGSAADTGSERRTAAALARRDPVAFAEVFRSHSPAVRQVAHGLLGASAPADEIVQDVFLGLWLAPERFDPGRGSLATYLRLQARARTLDMARAEVARHRREHRHPLPTVQEDLSGDVVERLTAVAIRTALAALPDKEREPIELAFYGGHSYRQVAALLGEPEGTVKARIRTGLGRLRSVAAAPTGEHG